MSFFHASSESSSLGDASRSNIEQAPYTPERPSTMSTNHHRQSSPSSQASIDRFHSKSQETVYFDDQKLPIPPYLKYSDRYSANTKPPATTGARTYAARPSIRSTNNDPAEEADAAAGIKSNNALERVSSIDIIARAASNPKLLQLASSPDDPDDQRSYTSRDYAGTTTRIPEDSNDVTPPPSMIQPSWRLRDRMKTAGVGLIMALNVGTDPPDIIKPYPCAKLQCWMDPSSVTRVKAREIIGERLEAQYAKWQQQRSARPLKYRRALDPTVEDVRALCLWLRRQARHERVLLHYNGHGVPRPTDNGEIWVFDRNHTEYIPLSVSDLRQWAGTPTICILDCSSAGVLIPFLTTPPEETAPSTPVSLSPSHGNSATIPSSQVEPLQQSPITDMDTAASLWVKDMIVLCPTSENEWLPMHPDYPADLFTSCLTTPIQVALRWFVRNNPASMGCLDPEAVDNIPGQANDRKTPLGELNWILTAITDSIAWNVLPKPLFQRLFRQDLLVASMFRNFLLADRIFRSMNCTPQSYPPLPRGVADHPLWYAWDLACENCLFSLIKDGTLSNERSGKKTTKESETENRDPHEQQLRNDAAARQGNIVQPTSRPTTPSPPLSSPFFTEQLTAFEIWLEYAAMHKGNTEGLESPEQLPIVLQVLLSQVHRIRALELLRQFLELGPWAVNLSLSLGVFPYVMKLLQSPEYKSVLLNIWATIIKFDPSCQVDLVKDNAVGHFIQPLANWASTSSSHPSTTLAETEKQRTLAAFSLAATCYKYPHAQKECMKQNLHTVCSMLLAAQIKLQEQQREQAQLETQNRRASNDASRFELLSPTSREWVCLCLGNFVQAHPPAQGEAYNVNAHLALVSLMRDDDHPNVRAAATYALGCLFEYIPPSSPITQLSSSQSNGDTSTMTNSTLPGAISSCMATPPSPISLGPQAFAIPSPSIQPRVIAGGQSSISHQPQMFLPQPVPTSGMKIQESASTTTMQWQMRHNVPQGTRPVEFSMVQFPAPAADAAPLQHQILVGGGALAAQGALQTIQQQQSRTQLMGPQMMQQRSNNNSAQAPQHNAPGLAQGSHYRHELFRGAVSGAMQSVQQGAVAYPRGMASQTSESAGHIGPMISSSPMNMMTSSQASSPIGMPLIGSPIGSAPTMMNRQLGNHTSPEKHRRWPTVFEDRRRAEFDLKVMEIMVKAVFDGSAMVRHEVVMALSCLVEKYLQAFLVVAEDAIRSRDAEEITESDNKNYAQRAVPLPRGVNQLMMERFGKCWATLREIQHHDPHPRVSGASNTIVRVVHETLLDISMEKNIKRSKKGKPPGLSEIQEEGEEGMERAVSEVHLSALLSPNSRVASSLLVPRSDGPSNRPPSVSLYPLRRSASETAGQNFPSMDRDGLPLPPIPLQNPMSRVKAEKLLPKSMYYTWKKSLFQSDYDMNEHADADLMDPLNPFGAILSYQRRRNSKIRKEGQNLANRFVDLKPRITPPKTSLDSILQDEEDDDEKYESLKSELRVMEAGLLRNDPDTKMTSILRFHSFETALVSCDSEDSISVWDYEMGRRKSIFRNGNPVGSRMTSALWINETSSSLLCVGCDDGSARVWKGIVEGSGDLARQPPSLLASFFAVPSMEPGTPGKSGLICEWQQKTGTFVAGGSSNQLHCWDLASEKCATTIDTETQACITSLATAWDEENPMAPGAYRGMGPEVIVAGHSDGTLKIFDVRMPRIASSNEFRTRTRRKMVNATFDEHGSWVVDVCFSTYGGKSEVISGSVAGDIRAWDLRMTSSSRAIIAQRSPMTALALHKRVPMIATGSHAQFIKILTLEGEVLQVVRFHEEMQGHRIGPVSCLEFHKEKHILAAGSTNALVNIYKPRARGRQ